MKLSETLPFDGGNISYSSPFKSEGKGPVTYWD